MPVTLTGINAQPEVTYRLRDTYPSTGGLLWAWDSLSRDFGLCEGQSIAQQVVGAQEKILCVIEGPPCTVFTLAVSSFQFGARGQAPITSPGVVNFQLLCGQGRAASRVTNVAWTPAAYLTPGDQQWVFQETRRLASTWWLFASISSLAGPVQEATIDLRVLLSRGTPTVLAPPQLGPGVVALP